jgi:KDO2-lipid IV(A) lauroyltransferase
VTAKAVRHRLEYGVVMALRVLVRWLPDRVVWALGAALGRLGYLVMSGRRELALRQLREAFPTRSEADCRAIARAAFVQVGRHVITVVKFSTLTLDQMRARLEFEGDDRIRLGLAAGKGVIAVTGHFGYWEIMGLAHGLALPTLWVTARQLDNPHLHAFVEQLRQRTGNRVIYRHGAVRRILRALQANETVAMLPDQHVHGSDAVRVDFFNRPVATTSAVASLALRSGAPIVPGFAVPIEGGRIRVVYEPPVELPAAGSPDPVRELTQRYTDVLEMYVRRQPHFWLWMHRRWRDLDDDSPDLSDTLSPSRPTPVEEAGDESRGVFD